MAARTAVKLTVKPGDMLRGDMVQDPSSGQWTVRAVALATNETSTYTAALAKGTAIDAAYITMEGMIIYSCSAYPSGGSVTFAKLSATDAEQRPATLKWEKEIRHSECGQDVASSSDGSSVTLKFHN